MEKHCPYCGAALPKEAAFCPYCAKSLNQRVFLSPPRHVPARLFRGAALLAALILALCALFYVPRLARKSVFDGLGQVDYADADGSYQLLTSSGSDRYTPVSRWEEAAGGEDSYRFPLNLYINAKDSGQDASGIFMQKVASVSLHAEQPEDSPSPVTCSKPEPMDFNEGAALVSLIDFTRESASPVQFVWTLDMKNGDTIRLSTQLTITPTRIYSYSQENADLSTTEALQALVDQIAASSRPEDSVNILLPPIAYTKPLILPNRSFNLTGSEENGQRTTFTAGIRMDVPANGFWISYFTGIDFAGDGTGVGLSATGRAWAKDCRFTNWKTAILGYGNTWVNATDCLFEDNKTGLHFNSTDFSPSDSRFTDNTFTGNGTAVLLENVPSQTKMDFSGCTFSKNILDIDNPCRQPLDISRAVFQ